MIGYGVFSVIRLTISLTNLRSCMTRELHCNPFCMLRRPNSKKKLYEDDVYMDISFQHPDFQSLDEIPQGLHTCCLLD